ncbi:hypothetical protein GCM10022251_42230 [Phytohabitans flavus]|uniref:Uncharacterized protein n=1 Tax=Phytohabitans flavus TaxID=1076124 RepID=A0A6F8Y0E0_9ACTN|nr:hypothetical protein Pflav_059400 [Phytohabitans flavus]
MYKAKNITTTESRISMFATMRRADGGGSSFAGRRAGGSYGGSVIAASLDGCAAGRPSSIVAVIRVPHRMRY